MDAEFRRYQVETHQQALRAEAANERLARGRQDRVGGAGSMVHVAHRVHAIRQALATMTTIRLVESAEAEPRRHGSRL